MQEYNKILEKYMPQQAAPIIAQWIIDAKCFFKISKSRSTKLGDYRAPYGKETHRISINHDLNPYAFLITTVHEFAHLKTWNQHKHKVKPHGLEWKANFQHLMEVFFQMNIFPKDIECTLKNYMSNPAASSCSDISLIRILKTYDKQRDMSYTIEDLEDNDLFKIKNGRTFQRIEKIRKRYKCLELSSKRIYLFHPVAEVFPLQHEEQ